MIERDNEIVEILELDNRTGVTQDGEVVALDSSDTSLNAKAEREYPEADLIEPTESADPTDDEIDERNEIRIENWLDLHRSYDETKTRDDACKALGIRNKETLIAESAKVQINATDVASSAIIKARKNK